MHSQLTKLHFFFVQACDCNSIGALDNFCNATTGQCKCRANTYGRECDQCRTGFWNFPNCQRCDCNGHADICNSHTGACVNCRDNTQGHTCDICLEGYYGDPRLGVDIPCRQCPCPGITSSVHSFADRCSLDPYTKDVVCDCWDGYSGKLLLVAIAMKISCFIELLYRFKDRDVTFAPTITTVIPRFPEEAVNLATVTVKSTCSGQEIVILTPESVYNV